MLFCVAFHWFCSGMFRHPASKVIKYAVLENPPFLWESFPAVPVRLITGEYSGNGVLNKPIRKSEAPVQNLSSVSINIYICVYRHKLHTSS